MAEILKELTVLRWFQALLTGLLFCLPGISNAGTCVPEPFPVTLKKGKRDTQLQGKPRTVEVWSYRAESKILVVSWEEVGDPAELLLIRNKQTNQRCLLKSNRPFLSFTGDFMYQNSEGRLIAALSKPYIAQAKKGRFLIIKQGIGSSFHAAVYDTRRCKRVGFIDELYPEGVSAPVRLGPDSTITFGTKKTVFNFGDNCVPVPQKK